MQRILVGVLALAVATVCIVPAALADSLGPSISPVAFSAGVITPGSLVGSPSEYSISGDGPIDGALWGITTTAPLNFSGTNVSMNGGTATFSFNDSVGGLLNPGNAPNLVWTTVITDPTNSSETDLIGSIASLAIATYPPTPSNFSTYFANLTNGGPATITVVLNCGVDPVTGKPISCTSVDPTGSIVGVDISPAGSTIPTPEPGTLLLLASALPALYLLRRRLAL